MRVRTALMWFDNDPKVAFEEKVRQAASAYEGKFGRHPDICYANPKDVPDVVPGALGLLIEPEPSVLPHHLLVGVARP
jgi:hypothetical protein